MSKSAIYTVLTTPTALQDGDTIPIGTTQRRYGCNVSQEGNTIHLCGRGYYKVTAILTVLATAATPVTFSMLNDGVQVIGAEVTATVAGTSDEVVLPISAIVRNTCDGTSNLSFKISGNDGTADNFTVVVEKL